MDLMNNSEYAEDKRQRYIALVEKADKAQVCKDRHACHRRDAVMAEWYDGEEDSTCFVCDAYEARKLANANGKKQSFLIVAYGVSLVYLGREEGGSYGDATRVLEVREAYTFAGGLKAAKELRNEYPTCKYGRTSVLGGEDVAIACVYSENDPRMPENYYPSKRYE